MSEIRPATTSDIPGLDRIAAAVCREQIAAINIDLHVATEAGEVDTLTYRGLWLDGLADADTEIQLRALHEARARCAQDNRLSTSTALPLSDISRLHSALLADAELYGEFHRWEKVL